ncbi:MAG: histidinol dehydrogenase, partial [Chloroflexota bacterium]
MRIWDKEQARGHLLLRLPLEAYPLPAQVKAKIKQAFGQELSPEQVVAQIIAQVRDEGDAALKRLTASIDGIDLQEIEVGQTEKEAALAQVSPELSSALASAAERIETFHCHLDQPSSLPLSQGVGRRLQPLNRVGIYVPGGGANYPSTLLMAAIPARVAGVREVWVTTPPNKEGKVSPLVLAAAHLAGVDR